ncbi:hypothetical protein PHYSODRAFT_340298 [Phytophthora sojae]|uniref:RNase H type-1 domain-containing protein n=1 Tax=Phytophthora sojae (strain P6497) TaxID=1094619 RepID=G5A9H4_PHYSP|nr:hypothetical protein PHYSODRAFT_340298 [Phytophthora sojae]EGZ08549.1 hypothetical protein PHYSODRAFT_340298 [Phytophthora sojae]|eukprot:XP_009536721.1 hypothetical protein PHYSODRAFT_340298 [Phytophthora sojae]
MPTTLHQLGHEDSPKHSFMHCEPTEDATHAKASDDRDTIVDMSLRVERFILKTLTYIYESELDDGDTMSSNASAVVENYNTISGYLQLMGSSIFTVFCETLIFPSLDTYLHNCSLYWDADADEVVDAVKVLNECQDRCNSLAPDIDPFDAKTSFSSDGPRSVQSSSGRPLDRGSDAQAARLPTELALSPAVASALGKRDHVALREEGPGPAPGTRVFGPELPTTLHSTFQDPLPLIPRGTSEIPGSDVNCLADDEARAYGAEQLSHWSSLPGEVISPVDVVYDEGEEEYDMEAWVFAAFETGKYLGLVNAGRTSESWIKALSAKRRRQPLVSDKEAVTVSPKLLPAAACVAVLQTMLMEAGFEFRNVIPTWSEVRAVSEVSENLIRRGVEEVQLRLAVESLEWNKLMDGVGFHIRQPLEPLPAVQLSERSTSSPTDADGDVLMTDDAVELLGEELLHRLMITRTRRSSLASSASGQPAPKRAALEAERSPPSSLMPPTSSSQSLVPQPSVSQNVVPRTQSLVPRAPILELMASVDSVPSLVGPSGASDESMNAAAEGTDLSGHSSSGSSFLSAADYMVGSALSHMPGPSPMAMVMIAQESAAAAAADPGFGVSAGIREQRKSPARTLDATCSRVASNVVAPPSFVSSTTPAAGMNRGISTSSAMPRTQATSTKVADPESEKKPQKSVHSGKSSRSRKSTAKSASSKSSMSGISSRVSSSRSSRSGTSEVALVMMRQQEAALNQQQTASLMERLQLSEEALAAERESRRRDAEVAEAWVAAAVKMGRGTLIPPEAPLPSAALDAATAAVLAAAEEVKAESEGIAQSTTAHLAAFEDQLRNVMSAYLQKCALAQKVQRGTGSSETKRGRQPKAATQTRSSVAAVKEENSEETKSSAKGVARDSASGNSSSSGSLSSIESSSGSDSDWERGLAEELAPATVPAANGQSYTFRPYIQYGTVVMFDPHAKLEDRVNWWERFVYAAALGVWPEKMKLRQLLGRLPAPLRAWFRQLPEKDQKDWSRLSKLFRNRGVPNGESAGSFLYRLNAAAKKADVEYEDSPSDRELHIRRFIKKLSDRRLKITLQGQTFKSMKELEKTLKRIEAVQRDDGYETPPPPKTRDAKPSGVRFSRFPPPRRTQGERAYLVENLVSESEDKASPPSDSDEKPEPRYLPGTLPPSMGRTVNSEKINVAQASETIVQVPRPPTTEEVFRAAEQMVITYIRSRTRVTLTLGMRVVYVLDMWVGNIGDGVACLLGMDFMKAAGVRLCAREQLAKLPNEEDIPLVGEKEVPRYILEVPICVREPVYLAPGDSIIVPVRYGQADADTAEVWTARGNQWVTQVIYISRRRSAAVRVVNISEKWTQIMQHTVEAALVEPGQLPRGDRFVQPKSRKYREWQQEIYQNTPSREYWRREELEALEAERNAPPAVLRPQYVWPTKILPRPPEEVRKAAELQKSRNASGRAMSSSGQTEEEARSHSSAVADVKSLALGIPTAAEVTPMDEAEASQADELDPAKELVIDRDSGDVDRGLTGGGTSSAEARHELKDVFRAEPVKICEGAPEQLEVAYAICLRVVTADLDPDEEVFFHEGTELLTQLRDQLAVLPDLKDLNPKVNMDEADVGVEGKTTPEMNKEMRGILEYHHSIFLGDGNAVPAPARGVVCDLDVGDAKSIAQRARPIAPRFLHQVYELIKTLLETGLIETSYSEWASPIVIILKKNGRDIRLPDGEPAHQALGYGEWLLGGAHDPEGKAHFCFCLYYQWLRMPFGLKNAPLIYQQMLNNYLRGFVRLSPEEEAKVDPDVLEFLGIKVDERAVPDSGVEIPALTDTMTVFHRNIPAPVSMGPVLDRSSYIDDIAHGAPTWDQLCSDLNALLFRLRYWGISVSLPKSEFGKLPSFLGSINCYNKFIEDLPVIALVLYELTEEQVREGRDLGRAKEAFEILKKKIVSTPLLRHPDREKGFLPEWTVVSARGYFLEDVTVNDAEYHGLIKGATRAMEHGVYDLVVVGDSRIAIQQAQGLINCHQPNLQRLLSEFDSVRQKFQSVKLIHVKREFNQAADYLISRTLAAGESLVIDDPLELSHLRLMNRIPEKLVKQSESGVVDPLVEGTAERRVLRAVVDEFPDYDNAPLSLGARVLAALTRSQAQAEVRDAEETESDTPGMTPLEFQAERWRRIKAHQDGDPWMRQLKAFLRGGPQKIADDVPSPL